MSSRFLRLFALVLAFAGASAWAAPPQPLRICADPDDLPFSHRNGQGLDNRIASLVARDIGRAPVFVWARSRRGFLRERFNKNACDVLMGVPQGMRGLATTVPYYHSTYVFVTRQRDHLQIASFTDPHLDRGRIGLQILEEDLAPPSLPLIRTGHTAQLVGFPSFGNEASGIVRAVAQDRVATAVVWGPVAGYFTATQHLPLTLTAVSPSVDQTGIPFAYAICMGVHKNDTVLRDALNQSITRVQSKITAILTRSTYRSCR